MELCRFRTEARFSCRLPIDRPPRGSEEKIWLLLARPFVWIEAEVKEMREAGKALSAKSVWSSGIPFARNEDRNPVQPLPWNDQVKEILQAIVTDVLTNPSLKSERNFYGTVKDKNFRLVHGDKLGWPNEFKAETPGYQQVVQRDRFGRRVLGIRLDK